MLIVTHNSERHTSHRIEKKVSSVKPEHCRHTSHGTKKRVKTVKQEHFHACSVDFHAFCVSFHTFSHAKPQFLKSIIIEIWS